MGAVQAQDYLSSLWAIGARFSDATEAKVEKAIADRAIVRTWPMRGTLHFIAPCDVRWILEYLAPRVISAAARRHRELELDGPVFARSEKILTRALEGGKALTRPEMMSLLERGRIAAANQRGYHILWRLALSGILCGGPREGKQQTFVLLDEWIPSKRRRPLEEELANFALRYFTSHGPATAEDFGWWMGIKKSEACAAIDSIASHLSSFQANGSTYWLASSASTPPDQRGSVYLLPSFDELLIGYTNRSDAVAPEYAQAVAPGANGMFMPIIVKGGRVVGTWKRTLGKANSVSLTSAPLTPFSNADLRGWKAAAKHYADFLGTEAKLS